MYSEQLTSPHPLKDHDESRDGLYEAAGIDELAQQLADLQTSDPAVYETVKLDVARYIANEVAYCLWFPQQTHERDDFAEHSLPYPLPLETLSHNQITNCYGYTLATSECLEAVGIEHWVAYANGHAFLLIPYGDNADKNIQLLDPLSPHFNQPIKHAISWGDSTSIDEDVRRQGRSAVMLDSMRLSAAVGLNVESASNEHPWLVFEKGQIHTLTSDRYIGTSEQSELAKFRSRYKLVMSVFEADRGRQSIADFVAFQTAVSDGDYEGASDILGRLAGYYPDIDARQSHGDIRNLATALSKRDPEHAASIVTNYFDQNFSPSGDSRIPEAKGDILRALARKTRHPSLAAQAATAYQEAARHPRAYHAAVLGKLLTARILSKELEEAHAGTF